MKIIKICHSKLAQNLQFVKTPDSLNPRETIRGLRDAVINEQLAIQQYENLADSIDNAKVQKTLNDIAAEEKVHIGELQELLSRLDDEEETSIEEGAKEVKESHVMRRIKTSADDSILKNLRQFLSDVEESWGYVTPEELHQDEQDYYLLDIRDSDAFEQGHIKGANNIFWQDLLDEDNLKQLPKDKTILLICYVGHTASQMLVALSLLGYDVKALKFGMGKSPVEGVPVAGWLDFGFEVEQDN